MTTQRFAITLLFSALLVPAGLVAFNAWTDQSLVLHGDLNNRYWNDRGGKPWKMTANRRYLKTLYLLQHPHDFDAYLMGSSRVGSMNISLLGSRWYRYNFEFAMPQDHLQHLKVLLQHGIIPKQVIIGIDRFNFYAPYPMGHVLYYPYPLDWQEKIRLLGFYLFKRPSELDWDIALGHARLKRDPDGITDDGSPWDSKQQARREATRAQWEKKLLSAGPFQGTLNYTTLRLEPALEALREIQRLCREHGITLTLYMQPFHYKNYLAMNPDELDIIFRELAAIQPFRDFSGLNAYTIDNFYWEETSHFLGPVNDGIARVLTGQAPSRADFGAWVTPDNVAEHRAAQRAAIARQLPALLAYDHNIQLHPALQGQPPPSQ